MRLVTWLIGALAGLMLVTQGLAGSAPMLVALGVAVWAGSYMLGNRLGR